MSNYQDSLHGSEIAVVGMAGRFPGANTPDEFWENLRNGVESITFYTDDELRANGVSEALLRNPHYVKAGAPLVNMEMFDAGFFGFSQRDASVLDPQHRHFLEVSWEALENAGYDPFRYEGPIGVFGGSGHNAYMPYNLLTNPDLMNSMGFFLVRHTGNDKDFLTTRVSYLFNLKGPSINVQTACSTSLVAIHIAIQSLLALECDMALAGGVTFELPHRQGYLYEDGEILSPDGHCRAFDADSQGTVFGSGAGVVVLKRLDDALEDGDTIHAVIKGSAINNDGLDKASYLAPSTDGQAKAIIEAIETADVEPSTISYVETHGTGTPIGDPIETSALVQAFRNLTDGDLSGFKVGIGSVKTNIGHLDTAAGVASFIKLVQAMKHKQLPPSLNFNSLNPAINFDNTPFYVNATLQDWEAPPGSLRRGGVSSLGVGGTNAHIILEEAPALPPSAPPARNWQILPLSARSRGALDAARERLAGHLRQHPEQNLADVAYTLKVGRKAFNQRGVIVARTHEEAAQIAEDGKLFAAGSVGKGDASVVFMFPGGGAQYPNMGRDLYDTEPLYRQIVDDCFDLLDFDLKPYLFPPDDADLAAVAEQLERPSLALPALFITEYALARLWMSWGIQPRTMTGHSMGEYTVACLAGVMTMAEGLRIVTTRGRLFETLPEGGMISVLAPEESVRPLLIDALDIAVINSPNTCVVSGEVASIERMEAILTEQGLQYKRVPINVAAHSPMLEPILEAFHAEMKTVRLQPPQIPYITNVTGTWVRPEDATDPSYWVRHLRHTVRFSDGIAALPKDSNPVLLEVGPGKTLTSLARQHPDAPANPTLLTSLRPPQEWIPDQQFALMTLGRLWAAGYAVDWEKIDGKAKRYRVPLPTYPFEHQRYWVEPGNPVVTGASGGSRGAALARSSNLEDWFYKPAWQQTALASFPTQDTALHWLVTLDETGLGAEIAQQLRAAGQTVVTVAVGWVYEKIDTHSYKLDPPSREEYTELFEALAADDLLPDRIVHTWSVTGDHTVYARESFYEKRRDQGLYSLMVLAQVLDDINHNAHIGVISDGMQRVTDEQLPYPEKATLLGPVRVIPQEMPRLTCQSIDLTVNASLERDFHAQQIIAELAQPSQQNVIAYRNGQRWVQTYLPAPLPPVKLEQTHLRRQGVYLITGGLGGIGLTVAEHLAKTVQARLVLIGRSGLPPREQWAAWLSEHGPNDSTSRKIRKVQHLESLGAQVLVLAANVIIPKQLESAVAQAIEHFGAIHGLIHAAGTLNDNLIQLKTTNDTEQVLAPKVRGILYLNDLLRGQALDFVVLFSSTSTLIGSAGQVDYIAANAVLNALADSQNAQGGPYTIAINWGIWQEVGMAHAAAVEMGLVSTPQAEGRPMKHPLLGNIITDQATDRVYSAVYTVADSWLLNEHRIKNGEALIPGTGYLEIVKAALAKDRPHVPVEIEELYFVAALDVRADEQREVKISLSANDDGRYDFIIASRALDGDNWQDHVYGRVRELDQAAPAPLDLNTIAARCTAEHQVFEIGQQETQQERHLDFGPRWKNLREVRFGEGEALAHLVLQDQFADDLTAYTLHPALMDLATGFALPLAPGYRETNDLFVPFNYQQVRVYGPLPQRIYSYARLGAVADNLERVSLNLTITDEQGKVLVTIEAFTMVRINPAQMVAESAKRAAQKSSPRTPDTDKPTLLQLGITDGIRPEEGVEAFTRALSKRGGIPSQVIVSSLPLAPLIDYLNDLNAPAQDSGGMKFERPAHLQSAFVAPENEIERKLVEIWEDSLGIQGIGTEDNFFDLGGESLIAVRVFMAVKKAFAVDLALDTLLQLPTIRQLAEVLHVQVGDHHEKPDQVPQESLIIPLQSQGTKAPLFCIHDLNGFVLYYRDLAKYLPTDRPLYAIQAHGINSKQHGFDSSIEAMSDRYLAEIRRVQPEGPYFLCGSSLGGIIAYDLAQKLITSGQEVAFLGVFDSWHPAYLVEVLNPPRAYSNPMGRAMMHLREFAGKGPAQYMHQRLQNRERWQAYQDKLEYQARQREAIQRYLQSGDPMPEKLRTFHREELFAHAYQSYVPAPYPSRMTLFIAEERTLNDNDPKLGWGRIPIQDLEVYHAPGPHGFMVRDPYVAGLAAQLQRCLDRVQEEIDQHQKTPQR